MRHHLQAFSPNSRVVYFYLLFLAFVCCAGYYFYSREKQSIEKKTIVNLGMTADVKAEQISEWRSERFTEARSFFRERAVHVQTAQFLADTSNSAARSALSARLKPLFENQCCQSFVLFTADGKRLFALSKDSTLLEDLAPEKFASLPDTTDVVFSDFQKSVHHAAVMRFLIPVIGSHDKSKGMTAFFVWTIDPEQKLYPILRKRTESSKTADLLLLYREGDEAVVLNELRYQSGAALNLRIPLNLYLLPAQNIAGENTAAGEGRDYRGVDVFFSSRSIPNSPWILVAQVDKEEIFSSLRNVVFYAVLVLVILSLFNAVVFFMWKRNHAEFERYRKISEDERLLLVRHLEYLSKYANDAVFVYSADGHILDVNDRTCALYGYTREEFKELDFHVLRAPDMRPALDGVLDDIRKTGGLTYQTVHMKKDGTLFPVDISTRCTREAETYYYQSVVRDITKEKAAENELKQSEQRFRATFEQSALGICHISLDGSYIRVNDMFCKMTGYTREELIGRSIQDITHEDDHIIDRESLRRLIDRVQTWYSNEKRYIHKNGTIVWGQVTVAPVIAEGKLEYLVGMVQDITEKKDAQFRIIKLNRIYAVLSNINQAIVRFKDFSELTTQVCRIIVEEGQFPFVWIGMFDESAGTMSMASSGGVSEAYGNALRAALSKKEFGDTLTQKIIAERKTVVMQDIASDMDAAFWKETAQREGLQSAAAFPIFIGNDLKGAIAYYSAEPLFMDDEEIHLLEELAGDLSFALENSEKELMLKRTNEQLNLLRFCVDRSSVGVQIIDPDGKIISMNDKVYRDLGYTPEEMSGLTIFDIDPTFPRDTWGEEWISLGKNRCKVLATVNRRKDGTCIPVRVMVNRIDFEGQEFCVSFVEDRTEQMKAEQALRISEENYRKLFENDLTGDFISRIDGTVIACNQAYARMFGFHSVEEVYRANAVQWYKSPEQREKFMSLLRKQRRVDYYEMELQRIDGKPVFIVETAIGEFDEQGNLVSIMGFIFDDTNRKILEDHIAQTQKMEGIGTLASGIAHDFNNILGIILAQTTLLDALKARPQKYEEGIRNISHAVQRGAMLVHQILMFARKDPVSLISLDVNEDMRQIVQMLEETFPKTIDIALDLEIDLPPILFDQTQFQQTVLNLCVNARDAMPGKGTLTLASSRISGSALSERFAGKKAETYVALSVKDTGSGMDEQTKARMYEPFFTTKPQGKGTGLGLAVVYGIVQSHEGFIDVQSCPNQGTTFTLFFPVPEKNSPAENISLIEQKEELCGGKETILLVEDEEGLLEILADFVSQYGYRVLQARNGVEGLQVFQEHRDEIDIVLSDIGMPKLSGDEMLRRIVEICPGTKVVLASGYFDQDQKETMENLGAKAFIQKPYRPEFVLGTIRTVLDGTERTANG